MLEKIRKYIFDPKSAFKAEKKIGFEHAIIYAFVGLTVLGFLSGLLFSIFQTNFPYPSVLLFLFIFLGSIFIGFSMLIISSFWFHFWAKLFGAKTDWSQTAKALIYAKTPYYYLGWIPLAGLVAWIWSLALLVLGLEQLQKLSRKSAIAVVLLGALIPLAAIIIFLFSLPIDITKSLYP